MGSVVKLGFEHKCTCKLIFAFGSEGAWPGTQTPSTRSSFPYSFRFQVGLSTSARQTLALLPDPFFFPFFPTMDAGQLLANSLSPGASSFPRPRPPAPSDHRTLPLLLSPLLPPALHALIVSGAWQLPTLVAAEGSLTFALFLFLFKLAPARSLNRPLETSSPALFLPRSINLQTRPRDRPPRSNSRRSPTRTSCVTLCLLVGKEGVDVVRERQGTRLLEPGFEEIETDRPVFPSPASSPLDHPFLDC